MGVFLGEFVIFSKKEEQVLSHRGSALSLLLLLPLEAWMGLDELMGVSEETPPSPNAVQFLSWPEPAVGVL